METRSNFIIPAKSGIQDVWVATMAPTVLDARFRGHDDGFNQSPIKIRHHNYETQY